MGKKSNQQPNVSKQDTLRLEESRRILDRVERESETVATSSMARISGLVRDNLNPKNGSLDDENDPIEILGKRLGRMLGWLVMIGLIFYLVFTYVL